MTRRPFDVERLSYRPAGPYRYDLELFLVSDLKRRTGSEAMHRTYSYAFHMLICVTRGKCVQLVDFEPVSCSAGAVLAISPGQAHNFGTDENWDGWILLFRPEFLLPAASMARDLRLVFDLEGLPSPLMLNAGELARAEQAILRMREDSLLEISALQDASDVEDGSEAAEAIADVQALLRYQFYAFLTWLVIINGSKSSKEGLKSGSMRRFHAFRKLVEQRFAEWSKLSDYARHMGCTERSLTRATAEAVGMSAKAFLSRRVNLEAKRLLAHTDLPIGLIAERLGFAEPTHFSAFFKRETGCAPSTFRNQSASTSTAAWAPKPD